MKALRLAGILIVFAVACLPVSSYASVQFSQEVQADAVAVSLIGAHDSGQAAPAVGKPVISVGLTDPDTQLNLPWFLCDIVDAVNTRTSVSNLLRAIGHDLSLPSPPNEARRPD